MEKYKILWVSNNPLMVTGYAKVTREVCTRLAKHGHQVFIIGDQYVGQAIPFQGCTLLPRVDTGQDLLSHWIDSVQPTHIVFLEDTFTLANQKFHQQPWQSIPAKVIIYHPQDGWGVPTTGVPVLEAADHLIAMAKFSDKVVQTELGLESDIIYHGYDPTIYKPCGPDEKKKLRAKFKLPEDAFVMSYIGRNSMRKLNQLLLETVVKFMADHPNSYFIGHISVPNAADLDLFDFLRRGIRSRHGNKYDEVLNSDRIRFNPAARSLMMGAPESDMAEIYNVSDVYVSASSGEGFGMPLVEAMASGIPVVATNYTTTEELLLDGPVGPRGFAVDVQATWTSSFNVDHAIWNIDSAVNALSTLYSNKALREQYGKNGVEFCQRFCLWEDLVNQWEASFAKAVKALDNPKRAINFRHKYLLAMDGQKHPQTHPLVHAANGRPVEIIDATRKIFEKVLTQYKVKTTPALINLETKSVIYDEDNIRKIIDESGKKKNG